VKLRKFLYKSTRRLAWKQPCFKDLVAEHLLNLKSIENLSDLNNIPKLCPHMTLIILRSFCGVAER